MKLSLPATLAVATLALHAAAAPDGQADELVQRGRQALCEGRLDAAQEAFEAAVRVEDGPATRPWLIRSWYAAGRIEDGLAATEEFESAGGPDDVVAYLYGMGFHALAMRQAAEGGDGTTGLVFEDATEWLARAAQTVGDRFPDVDRALAESAWYALDLERARAAAERAVARPSADAGTFGLAGRIALSQYRAAADADLPEAADHLAQARLWLTRAASAEVDPSDAEALAARADDWIQLAYVERFAKDSPAAARALGQALERDPQRADFAYWLGALDEQDWDAALAGARAALEPQSREADRARDGLLAWWQGYGHWSRNTRAARQAAEREFLEALDRNPEYANAWYYVASSRYTLQDRAGALEALRSYWAADPEGAAEAIAANERDRWMLEGLIGWCAGGRDEGGEPDNDSAAFLCEILTRAQPDEARHWNNLGLFLRDAGDALWRKHRGGPGERDGVEECLARWERALAAYRHALELEPNNPVYLNDTAVVLHYNLGRDLDQAADLYQAAIAAADEALARPDLEAGLRSLFETARKDASTNLRRLEALARRRARGG